MTEKKSLIESMRREARCQFFERILNAMDSIDQLKSKPKGKTLSYYKGAQIVGALRIHTLAHSGRFVLSVPQGLVRTCPQSLVTARAIWGNNAVDDRQNLGNKESAFPMIVDEMTCDLAMQIIEDVFRRYAEIGCNGIS